MQRRHDKLPVDFMLQLHLLAVDMKAPETAGDPPELVPGPGAEAALQQAAGRDGVHRELRLARGGQQGDAVPGAATATSLSAASTGGKSAVCSVQCAVCNIVKLPSLLLWGHSVIKKYQTHFLPSLNFFENSNIEIGRCGAGEDSQYWHHIGY